MQEWTPIDTTLRTTIQAAVESKRYGITKLPVNRKLQNAYIVDNIKVSLNDNVADVK